MSPAIVAPNSPGRRLPRAHWPSVRGRARADRGPLLLAAVVVALATALTAAVPVTVAHTADRAVRYDVARAGAGATLTAELPLEADDASGHRVRQGALAEDLQQAARLAHGQLGRTLAAAVGPGITTAVTDDLIVDGTVPGRTVQLAYLAGGDGARVSWVAGRAPAASVPAARASSATRVDGAIWPVQIGLSQPTATRLGLRPGDRLAAQVGPHQELDLRVTGIFRPVDADDPAWPAVPALLKPLVRPNGTLTAVRMAALLTPGSLPDARLAVNVDATTAAVSFAAVPARTSQATASALATRVAELRASSGSSADLDAGPRWSSRLDAVLHAGLDRIAAARAQADVLLVAVLAVTVLVLLLAADLLAARRTPVLTAVRLRGASLPGLGLELFLESAAVVVVGGGAGLLAGRLLAGGLSISWPLPMLAVALVAPPLLSLLTAGRATTGRRAPANRSARRTARRTRSLRRVTLEALVVVAAAGAFTALHQRGVTRAGGSSVLLPALAPTLAAVVGVLVLFRLLPLLLGAGLRRATRSSAALPLLRAARAADAATRPLPFAVLTLAATLTTFALCFAATERHGRTRAAAADPLATGLQHLALAGAVVLFALGLLGVLLGAAAGAPSREVTSARLRTLGLRRRDTRRLATGELLPAVLLAVIGGALAGVLLARLTLGLLALRLLTGRGADPGFAVPWFAVLPVVLLVAAVPAVVELETARRRPEHLGQVLRDDAD